MPFTTTYVIPIVWMLLASITALVAEKRGYNFHEYYWMAMLLPGISLALLFMKRPEPVTAPSVREPGCDVCGEPLIAGDVTCTMCGADIPSRAVSQS
jgi:hypothetical protein